jgi:hypothetical protein
MVKIPSSVAVHIKKEEASTTICDQATAAATPKLSSIYAAGKYTQVRAKGTQCSPILHSFLSSYEYSLIFQAHASLVYLLML